MLVTVLIVMRVTQRGRGRGNVRRSSAQKWIDNIPLLHCRPLWPTIIIEISKYDPVQELVVKQTLNIFV